MGVFTAVSNQPISPACEQCSKHACSQCKVTPGRDWTFTQFQPFANFNATAPGAAAAAVGGDGAVVTAEAVVPHAMTRATAGGGYQGGGGGSYEGGGGGGYEGGGGCGYGGTLEPVEPV